MKDGSESRSTTDRPVDISLHNSFLLQSENVKMVWISGFLFFVSVDAASVPDSRNVTLSLLRRFLTGNLENAEIPTDLFLDLYYLFKRLEEPESPLPSPQRIKNRTERWARDNKYIVSLEREFPRKRFNSVGVLMAIERWKRKSFHH